MTSLWGQLWNEGGGGVSTPPPHPVCGSAHRYAISGSHSSVLPQGLEYKAAGRVERAVPRISTLRLIPGEKPVVSLLGIMGGQA